ncbi:hypothetical protein MBLNU230_g2597t1 [Neophaeotheca triangularis]
MSPIIVFGPTGAIGSIATLTALTHSSSPVWLAMRDPSKPIPHLPAPHPESQKLHADLLDPSSVRAAIEKSNARRAFVYLAHGSADHMLQTFTAMRDAGVHFVAFVSSFSIPTDKELRQVDPALRIPYVHARAEANLADLFQGPGRGYVALRPGAFASNLLRYAEGIRVGRVEMFGLGFVQDNVAPADIGRVAGRLLGDEGAVAAGGRVVYLYGPRRRGLGECVEVVGKVLGREVEVVEQTREQALKGFVAKGMPTAMAEYMCEVLGSQGRLKGGEAWPCYEEGVKNVERYGGRPAMELEEWVRENKAAFGA